MAKLVRHRQTKEPETDRPSLKPPRHISTLHAISRGGQIRVSVFSGGASGFRWGHRGRWDKALATGVFGEPCEMVHGPVLRDTDGSFQLTAKLRSYKGKDTQRSAKERTRNAAQLTFVSVRPSGLEPDPRRKGHAKERTRRKGHAVRP
jgi:hypothetical protein